MNVLVNQQPSTPPDHPAHHNDTNLQGLGSSSQAQNVYTSPPTRGDSPLSSSLKNVHSGSSSATSHHKLVKQSSSQDSNSSSTSSPSATQIFVTPTATPCNASFHEILAGVVGSSPCGQSSFGHASMATTPLHSPTHVLHSPTQSSHLLALGVSTLHSCPSFSGRHERSASTNLTPPNSRSPTQESSVLSDRQTLPAVHGHSSGSKSVNGIKKHHHRHERNAPKQSKSHLGLTKLSTNLGCHSKESGSLLSHGFASQHGDRSQSSIATSSSSNPIHKSAPSLVSGSSVVVSAIDTSTVIVDGAAAASVGVTTVTKLVLIGIRQVVVGGTGTGVGGSGEGGNSIGQCGGIGQVNNGEEGGCSMEDCHEEADCDVKDTAAVSGEESGGETDQLLKKLEGGPHFLIDEDDDSSYDTDQGKTTKR